MTQPTLSPLTPAVFHILLALSDGEQHGYRIMQLVELQSGGKLRMGPGTLYGSIKRMLEDGLIEEAPDFKKNPAEDERRRYYRLTEAGRRALMAEAERISLLVGQLYSKRLINKPGEGLL